MPERAGTMQVLPNCRLSFVSLFETRVQPSGDNAYQVCLMFAKTNKVAVERYKLGIEAAKERGLEQGKFTKAKIKSLKLPIHDGDVEYEAGDRGEEFQGFYYINAVAKPKFPPNIVGPDKRPLIDPADLYSGCWAHADVNFYPFGPKPNQGIGVGITSVMKIRDDDRLDGRRSPDEAFAEYEAEAPDESVMDETEGELE